VPEDANFRDKLKEKAGGLKVSLEKTLPQLPLHKEVNASEEEKMYLQPEYSSNRCIV